MVLVASIRSVAPWRCPEKRSRALRGRNRPYYRAVLAATLKWVNEQRRTKGLPSITKVIVPPFNAEQVRRDTIRGYNGFAGDFLNGPLHEYRLRMDGDSGRFVVTENGKSTTGTLIWDEVPKEKRPQDVGDPDYVNHVLSQTPWTP